MQRIALAILALALSTVASAATIIISGSGPVADRTINVPGCYKLTTGVNQAKESIGVICYHVAGTTPLFADPAPLPPAPAKAALAAKSTQKGK
jgi:hypothetical protein